MKYPLNITLTKIETRDDAKHSQEEKYSSGVFSVKGLMWEFSEPKVGEIFSVNESKLWAKYLTSVVESIEVVNDHTMIIKTVNSKYKLEIDKER